MDDLIAEIHDIATEDISFLKTEDEDTLEKMLRSQQSKRSRAKSKVMTKDNYLIMMTGAVAEGLLRLAANKPKSAGGGAIMGDIGYSTEDLEKLADFPEELKKAIRNVQSKKSIMKSKADFDVQSTRWQQLLRAEQQLKEVRDQGNAAANEKAMKTMETHKKANELLAQAYNEDLKPEEAKDLLDTVRQMLGEEQ